MNCELCKTRMTDAAMDGLSARQRAEFDAHVRECSRCREEFTRMHALLETIDRSVMAHAAAEPSPAFVTRVRRKIAAEASPSMGSWARWAPATACAASVTIAAAMWMMWPGGLKRGQIIRMVPNSGSLVATNHLKPSTAGMRSGAVPINRTPAVSMARRVEARKPLRIERRPEAPEVIIQPGQDEALLQFAAALQSGELDGARLLAEQKEVEQPIEIKPLVIAPLEGSAQADKASSGPGDSGTENESVSEEPTRGLEP